MPSREDYYLHMNPEALTALGLDRISILLVLLAVDREAVLGRELRRLHGK